MLTVGQKRRSSKQVRVPERNLTVAKTIRDKPLPGVILNDEVADQAVVGEECVEFARRGAPGGPLKEVVGREHRPWTNGYPGIQQQRQYKITESDQQIPSVPFETCPDHAIGSLANWKTQALAPMA